MMSDHIAVLPDVAQEYPAPFYEPFTTLAERWNQQESNDIDPERS